MMGITSLLYSALLAPINILEPTPDISNSCPAPSAMLKAVLYESYIPLDALVFKLGADRMGKGQVNGIVDGILEAKRSILKNPENAAAVFNLSEVISSTESGMQNLLNKRLKLIKSDESFIFKELIREKQEEILKCIDVLREKKAEDPQLDKKYRQMVHRIYGAIFENLDIQDTISREKSEFYRIFDRSISEKEIKRAKIAVSLGSNIFYLPEALRLVAKVNLRDKEKFVREWVGLVFDHIEKLAVTSSSKSFIEQKYLAREFIKNSMETGPANNAFEARAVLIKAANLSIEEIKELSVKQNTENLKLMKVIENMAEGTWVIRYNKEIKEDLVKYLLTQQPSDKKRVLKHFE